MSLAKFTHATFRPLANLQIDGPATPAPDVPPVPVAPPVPTFPPVAVLPPVPLVPPWAPPVPFPASSVLADDPQPATDRGNNSGSTRTDVIVPPTRRSRARGTAGYRRIGRRWSPNFTKSSDHEIADAERRGALRSVLRPESQRPERASRIAAQVAGPERRRVAVMVGHCGFDRQRQRLFGQGAV